MKISDKSKSQIVVRGWSGKKKGKKAFKKDGNSKEWIYSFWLNMTVRGRLHPTLSDALLGSSRT